MNANRLVRIDKETGDAYVYAEKSWLEIPEDFVDEFPDFNGEKIEDHDSVEVWELHEEDYRNIVLFIKKKEKQDGV